MDYAKIQIFFNKSAFCAIKSQVHVFTSVIEFLTPTQQIEAFPVIFPAILPASNIPCTVPVVIKGLGWP